MAKRYYFETYGCQMNEYDSLVAQKLLQGQDYHRVAVPDEADIILINTCSVRENAHQKIYNRLKSLEHLHRQGTRIGILGCMAQNLGETLTKDLPVNFVVGPDSLRELVSVVSGDTNHATTLSKTETYDDIIPGIDLHVGIKKDSLSANVAIQRGCDNFCSFCVVPFTRGRERSRPPESIIQEVNALVNAGIKTVVLLGQNVNSYKSESTRFHHLIKEILEKTEVTRLYYTSPHPKDFPKELIELTAREERLGSSIHIPLQSGSDPILEKMRREYTAAEFLSLIQEFRDKVDSVHLSTDVIVGFPGETEKDFEETLRVMEESNFDSAFMFAYSEREHTSAKNNFQDDVLADVKARRLTTLIEQQETRAAKINKGYEGRRLKAMVEGISRRSDHELVATLRNSKKIIAPIPPYAAMINMLGNEYTFEIKSSTSHTLKGDMISEVYS